MDNKTNIKFKEINSDYIDSFGTTVKSGNTYFLKALAFLQGSNRNAKYCELLDI